MIDDVAKGLSAEFSGISAEVRGSSAEMQHLIQATVEELRREIRLVAEGLNDLREAIECESSSFREEMRRTAAETQAMIKSLHAGPAPPRRDYNPAS